MQVLPLYEKLETASNLCLLSLAFECLTFLMSVSSFILQEDLGSLCSCFVSLGEWSVNSSTFFTFRRLIFLPCRAPGLSVLPFLGSAVAIMNFYLYCYGKWASTSLPCAFFLPLVRRTLIFYSQGSSKAQLIPTDGVVGDTGLNNVSQLQRILICVEHHHHFNTFSLSQSLLKDYLRGRRGMWFQMSTATFKHCSKLSLSLLDLQFLPRFSGSCVGISDFSKLNVVLAVG